MTRDEKIKAAQMRFADVAKRKCKEREARASTAPPFGVGDTLDAGTRYLDEIAFSICRELSGGVFIGDPGGSLLSPGFVSMRTDGRATLPTTDPPAPLTDAERAQLDGRRHDPR